MTADPVATELFDAATVHMVRSELAPATAQVALDLEEDPLGSAASVARLQKLSVALSSDRARAGRAARQRLSVVLAHDRSETA